jgi:outer membrane protein assembly factor BamD
MNKFFLLIVLFTVLVSCSKKEEFKESIIKEKSLDLQVLEAYQEGMKI